MLFAFSIIQHKIISKLSARGIILKSGRWLWFYLQPITVSWTLGLCILLQRQFVKKKKAIIEIEQGKKEKHFVRPILPVHPVFSHSPDRQSLTTFFGNRSPLLGRKSLLRQLDEWKTNLASLLKGTKAHKVEMISNGKMKLCTELWPTKEKKTKSN